MLHSKTLVILGAGLGLVLTSLQPALAISEKNRELLAQNFIEQGEVQYELYTPLGGPEIGAALINSGGTRLEVRRVGEHGAVNLLLSSPLTTSSSKPPFTFLLTGRELLTYPTHAWTDAAGGQHQLGDLTIYDLTQADGAKKMFELQNVADLSYSAAGSLTPELMLWQPSRHFLNSGLKLPIKHDYCSLIFDQDKKAYCLKQHLTVLDNATSIDSANLNNRAILYYRQGRLTEASRLLEQAAQLAEEYQSVILHNQALIKGEMTDLAEQGNLVPDLPTDEALAAFWTGDYSAVLRAMESRQPYTVNDLAMLGLSLAWCNRWPEVDRMTVELERRQAPFFADYLTQLVAIARAEGLLQVASAYLTALQVTDQQHPGYITNLAEMQILANEGERAEAQLHTYINQHLASGYDLSTPRLVLYRLLYQRGAMAECKLLADGALAETLIDLRAVVDLVDYADLSSAMRDVPLGETDRILAPKQPLDQMALPEAGNRFIDPEDAVRPIEDGENQ